MYDRTHYQNVSEETLDTLDNWAKYGLPPGGFVSAVLENDLADAVRRADSGNSAALVDIVRYLINELPMGCWGTYEKVASWGEARQQAATCTSLQLLRTHSKGQQ